LEQKCGIFVAPQEHHRPVISPTFANIPSKQYAKVVYDRHPPEQREKLEIVIPVFKQLMNIGGIRL